MQYPNYTGGYPGQQSGAGVPGGYPQAVGYQQQAGYPASGGFGQQSGYPPNPAGYPQQQACYPQQQAGFPQQPYAGQAGFPQQSYAGQMPGQLPGQMPGQFGPPAPVRPVLGQEYCQATEQTYYIQESMLSLSGDDFEIMDMHQRKAFTLNSSAISLSSSRTLKNAGGRAVATMKKKMLSSHQTWYIDAPNGKEHLATIRKETTAVGQPAIAAIFLGGNTSFKFANARPDLTARGDFKAHTFWIYWGNQPVAEVSRKIHGALERFTSKNSYSLRVFPNMDAAFMVAVVTILDELFND